MTDPPPPPPTFFHGCGCVPCSRVQCTWFGTLFSALSECWMALSPFLMA